MTTYSSESIGKRTCIKCGVNKWKSTCFNKHGSGYKKVCRKCEEKNKKFLKNLKDGKYRKNKKKKERFLSIKHLRTDNDGCVTAACLVHPGNKEMRIGFAFCSPRDEFCKKKGKTIALRRMNDLSRMILCTFNTPITKEVFRILSDLCRVAPKEFPNWAPRFLKAFKEKMDKIARSKV